MNQCNVCTRDCVVSQTPKVGELSQQSVASPDACNKFTPGNDNEKTQSISVNTPRADGTCVDLQNLYRMSSVTAMKGREIHPNHSAGLSSLTTRFGGNA